MNFLKKIIIIFACLFLLVWAISLFAPKTENIDYGVSFSYPYAQSLGLDWKQTYLEIINDLKPKYIRLSAYWDSTEAVKEKYYFEDLDFQVEQAKKGGVKVILSVGRRLPRWPECHDPLWIKNLSDEDLKNAQLAYVAAVVERYQNEPSIYAWQVENEAFLATFGECPLVNVDILDSEIALVKQADPSRKIIITDSGELNFWLRASSRGDIFGTTLYRYVFSDIFKRYWTNHIPPIFYRFKAGLVRILNPNKPIAIMELQAEPWVRTGILDTPVDEQFKTMSYNNFNTILDIAKQTGFNPQILWGAEWWYWMKTTQNHPEFWDKAKELMKQ
jgi:hypothetical protein